MTIVEAAYKLCKSIVVCPARVPLQALIYELNHTLASQPAGYADRATFGYMARQQRSQFLGYLLIDQERAEITKAPSPRNVPPLTDPERALLLAAHSQIEALNQLALEPFLLLFPRAKRATNPYGMKRTLRTSLAHSNPPFPTSECEAVARAFQTHPLLPVALATPPSLVTGEHQTSSWLRWRILRNVSGRLAQDRRTGIWLTSYILNQRHRRPALNIVRSRRL